MDKGVLSGLNQKLAGSLAGLVEKGWWTGERGENLLLATQNMIKAEKVIFHGMGPENRFDEEILEKEIMDLGARLDKMGVSEFGINIPPVEGSEEKYGSYMEFSAVDLAGVFHKTHKDEGDFLLKMIFSVQGLYEGVLDAVVNNLRNRFHSMLEFSIIRDGPARYQEPGAYHLHKDLEK